MREGGHNTKRVQNLLRTSTYLEIFYKFDRAPDLKSKWQPEHKQQGLQLCEKRCHEMHLPKSQKMKLTTKTRNLRQPKQPLHDILLDDFTPPPLRISLIWKGGRE